MVMVMMTKVLTTAVKGENAILSCPTKVALKRTFQRKRPPRAANPGRGSDPPHRDGEGTEKMSVPRDGPEDPHPWHQTWKVCPLSFLAYLPTAADAPAKLTRNRRNPGAARIQARRCGREDAGLSERSSSSRLEDPPRTHQGTPQHQGTDSLRTELPPTGLCLPIRANTGSRIHHNLE